MQRLRVYVVVRASHEKDTTYLTNNRLNSSIVVRESEHSSTPRAARKRSSASFGIRNIFDPQHGFDPSALPEAARRLYEQTAAEIAATDPRAFARTLLEQEGLIVGLALEPEALVVETLHPDRLSAWLGQAAVDRVLDVTSIEPLDEDLRSVFAYLVE